MDLIHSKEMGTFSYFHEIGVCRGVVDLGLTVAQTRLEFRANPQI